MVLEENIRRNDRNRSNTSATESFHGLSPETGKRKVAVSLSRSNRGKKNSPCNSPGSKADIISSMSKCLNMSVDGAIQTIDDQRAHLSSLISRRNFRRCHLILLIQVVGRKLCGETVNKTLLEKRRSLIQMISTAGILTRLESFTRELKGNILSCKPDTVQTDSWLSQSFVREILGDLFAYYRFVVAAAIQIPVEQLSHNVSTTHVVAKELQRKLFQNCSVIKCVESNLLHLKQQLKRQNHQRLSPQLKNTSPNKILENSKPPNNFLTFSEVPSCGEILATEKPFLMQNILNGSYPSALNYLDVQYRLLREDFVGPLRDALFNFRNKRNSSNNGTGFGNPQKMEFKGLRFFHGVTLLIPHEVSPEKKVCSLNFLSPFLNAEQWDDNDWLLLGSLLILTPDNFQTIYLASVSSRHPDRLESGFVTIQWEGQAPSNYGDTFLMVEPEAYFVAYRYTLKVLQRMAQPDPSNEGSLHFERFPMLKYIVKMETQAVPPPKYLRDARHPLNFSRLLTTKGNDSTSASFSTDLDSYTDSYSDSSSPGSNHQSQSSIMSESSSSDMTVNPLDVLTWPSADEIGLDSAQYSAFQSAVTEELSVIQGPPGTGKTYIGLQLIKLFLSNPDLIPYPIFIICRTNHALDQFLEGVLSIMRSFGIPLAHNLLRVGGGCKSEVIERYVYYKNSIDRDILCHGKNLKRRSEFDNVDIRQFFKEPDINPIECEKADNFHRVDFLQLVYRELCESNGHEGGIVDLATLLKTTLDIRPLFDRMSTLSEKVLSYFLSEFSSRLEVWLEENQSSLCDLEKINLEDLFSQWFDIIPEVPQIPIVFDIDSNEIIESSENSVASSPTQREFLSQLGQWFNYVPSSTSEEDAKKQNEFAKPVSKVNENLSAKKLNYLFEFSANERKQNEQETPADKEHRLSMNEEEELKTAINSSGMNSNSSSFLGTFLKAVKEGKIVLPQIPGFSQASEFTFPLSLGEMWAIYLHLLEEIKTYISNEILVLSTANKIIQDQKSIGIYDEHSNMCINNDGVAKVVGITTTGAAKYAEWVSLMKPRVVIVEEAAEVLEAHVVTSITEHCEHLILIGDHKQLRPQTNNYKLTQQYCLDISLFERFIRNKLSWSCLKTQHRMRPQISKLLVPTIYEELVDHTDVLNYPNVAGCSKNLFFFDHQNTEESTRSASKFNEFEARLITKFCGHMVRQNYTPSQITILVMYNGQKFLVEELLRAEGEPYSDVAVETVDSYQGEENDIVLLSLVRNNSENNVGFLKTENRICVALSRARLGLYIFGNMACLVNSQSKMWSRISLELRKQNCIGEKLQFYCQIHGDTFSLKTPEDFERFSPEGGCNKRCDSSLPNCIHVCPKRCHVVDADHLKYDCTVEISKRLECGHRETLPCSRINNRNKERREDGMDPFVWMCTRLCNAPLDCGHRCTLLCHKKTNDPASGDHTDYNCRQLCARVCKRNHPCRSSHLCFLSRDCRPCRIRVEETLPCGHTLKNVLCSQDVNQLKCSLLSCRMLKQKQTKNRDK